MTPPVDFKECLIDSPKFRIYLQENEESVDQLEIKLDKLIKQTNAMVEAGKYYAKTQTAFAGAVEEIGGCLNNDSVVLKAINRIVATLNELSKYQGMLIDQTQRAVSRNLTNFVKSTLLPVKETKRHFDKISDELDSVLIRNSAISKTKQVENEEISNMLTATRSLFQHTSLDYVSQLSCLQSKKRHEILDALVSLLNAHGTYFHQGYDAHNEFETFLKATETELTVMRSDSTALAKQLERHHSLVKKAEAIPTLVKGENGEIRLEGYLFKRTSNAFKTWNRRWFMIQDHQLVYQKRALDKELTVMEDDLRLCSVKPSKDIDRRFCFEVVSPSKNHILQADSFEACQQWVTAMEAGINAAFNGNNARNISNTETQSIESLDSTRSQASSANSSSKSSLMLESGKFAVQILSVPGNEVCCDCGAPDPCWASINLSVTLCIECSGIHRSLGVHISKVRSLKLDDWEPAWVQIMLALGNVTANQIYEAIVDESVATRISASSLRPAREAWIKAKYVQRAFVPRDFHTKQPDDGQQTESCSSNVGEDDTTKVTSSNDNHSSDELPLKDFLNRSLHKAVVDRDLEAVSKWLGRGGDVHFKHPEEDGINCLHRAVQSSKTDISEFLLLNGAKCNVCNNLGRSPLHFAVDAGNTGQVCLLIKRGAELSILDSRGQDALAIAVEKADADIVTLLRLAKLYEEMKSDEMGNPGSEEIFNKVLGDFQSMASKKSSVVELAASSEQP